MTISHAGTLCCYDRIPIKQHLFRGPYTRKCTFKAKVVRAGKAYCGNHDPQVIAKRKEMAKNRWYATRGLKVPA